MRTFTSQNAVSTIARLSYSGSPSKSSFSTVASNVSCYLRPLSEEQASMNGYQYGTAFSAIFETSIDIQEADRVTLTGDNAGVYTVRGVVNHNRGRATAYKRCLLTKPEND